MPATVSSLIPTAEALSAHDVRPAMAVPVAVWEVLSTIPDPRSRQGRRHELPTVVVVALAAVLAGQRTQAAIAEWAADLPDWARPRLGITRTPPACATIRRVLLLLDPDLLDAVLHAWLAARNDPAVPATFRAVALDGKTCRGARTRDGTQVHLFSMVEHTAGIPLGQVETTGTSEIACFRTLLDRLDLTGLVVTADALHTQTGHAHYLHRHHGHYLFIVKGNQPTTYRQLAALPWKQVPIQHTSTEKAHGRRETRTLQIVELRPGIAFPHAHQALRIVRHRTHHDRTSKEVLYAVTSLRFGQLTPTAIATLIRGHWTIENRVHHVRDVTFDEDRSQVRTATLPRIMATLRNLAIGLIRHHHHGKPSPPPPDTSTAETTNSSPSSTPQQSQEHQE